MIDRTKTGLQTSQLIPDSHLALRVQSRKIRPTQVDWGWIWKEKGDTGNWSSRCAKYCAQRKSFLHKVWTAGNGCLVSLYELLPSKASKACTVLLLIYLTYPDISCFEGKMLLICIGFSPKKLRFMDNPMRGEWDWLQALCELSAHGAHPSFLYSQLTAKKMLEVWNLRPDHAFWDLPKWEPFNYTGHCEKHTLSPI